jgi:hypothetical protein
MDEKKSINIFDVLSEDPETCHRIADHIIRQEVVTPDVSENKTKPYFNQSRINDSRSNEKWHRPAFRNNNRGSSSYQKHRRRVLCQSFLENVECRYGENCKFANSLEEQVVDNDKKEVIDILLNEKQDLKHIDLVDNKILHQNLIRMTTMCTACEKGICKWGYNCNKGACNKKSLVCERDLGDGRCENKECCAVHLTKRGLIPYIKQLETKQSFIPIKVAEKVEIPTVLKVSADEPQGEILDEAYLQRRSKKEDPESDTDDLKEDFSEYKDDTCSHSNDGSTQKEEVSIPKPETPKKNLMITINKTSENVDHGIWTQGLTPNKIINSINSTNSTPSTPTTTPNLTEQKASTLV